MFSQVAQLQLMYNKEVDAFAIGIILKNIETFVPLYIFKDIESLEDIIQDFATQLRMILKQQEEIHGKPEEPKAEIPDAWLKGWDK